MLAEALVTFERRPVAFASHAVAFGSRAVAFARRSVAFGSRLVAFASHLVAFAKALGVLAEGLAGTMKAVVVGTMPRFVRTTGSGSRTMTLAMRAVPRWPEDRVLGTQPKALGTAPVPPFAAPATRLTLTMPLLATTDGLVAATKAPSNATYDSIHGPTPRFLAPGRLMALAVAAIPQTQV